jgi:capsule biosynthesis phosphatase
VKRIIIDLDGALAEVEPGLAYAERRPVPDVVEALRRYHAQGFEVVIHTSRNMRTYKGAIGRINAVTLPVIVAWLDRHQIPYDEIIVGKPWCGTDGFYVDDRAIRPSEFVRLSLEEITALIAEECAVSEG